MINQIFLYKHRITEHAVSLKFDFMYNTLYNHEHEAWYITLEG